MYTKTALMNALPALGAAIIACMCFAGSVAADDRGVTVAYQVSTHGLDLSQPAGAQALYGRLKHASQVVCTHGMRVDLAPSPDPQGCYEKALADAISSLHLPMLTQVYLQTHTLQQAVARGIAMPVQLAAK
jgi:UrcA family protein